MKQLWLRYKSTLLLLLTLSLGLLILYLSGMGCPVRYLTGISCPGCGMTRAMWCLLTLRVSDALTFHPLCVAMPPVAALMVWFSVGNRTKARNALFWITAAALVAVYAYRLSTGGGDVVVFAPREGLIGRILAYLFTSF